MKKTAGIAAGVVITLGVVATTGAWYTGTQLQGVLQSSIEEANQKSQDALLGTGVTTKLELVSLKTRLFTSTAHYRITLDAPEHEQLPRHLEILLVDEIQHGPLPASRLMRLNLWPVMASSNYALQATASTQKWFDAAKGQPPAHGQISLGYDGSTSGSLIFSPLEFAPNDTSTVKFSGVTLNVDATRHAAQVTSMGVMDSLLFTTTPEAQAPVQVELRGLTLKSDQTLGAGNFYVGDSDLKLATAQFKIGDKPALLARDIGQFSSFQENGGALSGKAGYDVAMISYDGKDLAGLHMLWSLQNVDVSALQSLVELYSEKAMQAQQDHEQGFDFSADEEARLKSDVSTLLAGKPRIALEKLSLKSSNGEASLSMAVDLNEPESLELPAPELSKQVIAQLTAKLSVDKAVIGDGVSAQAMFDGQQDAALIEDQAAMLTEMGSGMALGTGLLALEGETLQSSLRYANDKVTFNGKDMTVEEFVMFVMSKSNGLGVGQDGEMPSADEDYPEDDEQG